ncbi:hypothetical protein EYF80_000878 [Liparis tanakae]|uniref:Uncharacterized protein n=1 Tax=Liparis tanakae TaxID=230148 RepID=A0A4Z2JFQ1_9TELE|nr:hypothetical protein EYF80_000878 [Liparis tanakae]
MYRKDDEKEKHRKGISCCDNPDGILVTAVTRERERERERERGGCVSTTNSGLCSAADIKLCVFCEQEQRPGDWVALIKSSWQGGWALWCDVCGKLW